MPEADDEPQPALPKTLLELVLGPDRPPVRERGDELHRHPDIDDFDPVIGITTSNSPGGW